MDLYNCITFLEFLSNSINANFNGFGVWQTNNKIIISNKRQSTAKKERYKKITLHKNHVCTIFTNAWETFFYNVTSILIVFTVPIDILFISMFLDFTQIIKRIFIIVFIKTNRFNYISIFKL